MSFRSFRQLSHSLRRNTLKLSSPLSIQARTNGLTIFSRSFSTPVSAYGQGQQYSGSLNSNKTTTWAALAAALTLVIAGNFQADNCGIVGVVGTEDASGFLLEGLTILRNRGYDSAGIATIPKEGEEIFITKYASRETTADSIDLVRSNASKHIGHVVGIGHTRWATHGGKTDMNAHPHTDQHHRIALCHNGTINNAYELKKELQGKGIKFLSETDTEVIAQLVGLYLDKGMDTKEAVRHALGRYVESFLR